MKTIEQGKTARVPLRYLTEDRVEAEDLPVSVQYRIDAEPEPGVKRFARRVVRAWTDLPPDSTSIPLTEDDNDMAIDRVAHEIHVITMRVFYGDGAAQHVPGDTRYRVRRLNYLKATP